MTDVADQPSHPAAAGESRSGDVWGGLAAMLVAFPSSIAFGVVIFSAASPDLASAGAFAGIVGAAILGIVAPLVGRNGGLITAPSAPAAAVMSGLALELSRAAHLPAHDILPLLALTAVLSSALQIVYGSVRAGRLIKFIPYQVVNGYLSGVAVIIAMAQIPRLFGVRSAAAIVDPRSWSWPSIGIGVATLAAMALAPRVTRLVPGAIVGLAAGVAAYFVTALAVPELRHLANNPLVIGPIRSSGSFFGEISVRAGSFFTTGAAQLALIAGPALTLSVLLSIDTLKTGVVLDALTRRRHDSNRELIGQGVANLASAVAGGAPGSGTMGPTLVNVTSGGRTAWSGALEGVFVLVALLALGSLMAWVPLAALAGILLVIAWRMFNFHMFRLLLLRSTRLDFVVIASVVIVAAVVGLIEASVVGICLAILLFIRNQIRGSVVLRRSDLRHSRSKRRRGTAENAILDARGEEGLLVQLKDDLFFGTTDQLFSALEGDLASRRFILLDFRRVQSMDYTAAQLFIQMQERLHERGGQLLFSGMPSSLPTHQDIQDYMAQLGVVGPSGEMRIFETRDSALEWMEDRVLETAGWNAGESRLPLSLGEIELFRRLDAGALADLERCVSQRAAEPGARIFAAGEPGDEIFFVRRGRVHVLLPLEGGKRHHLATICRGDFFGEMSFLDAGLRSADAEAATPTDLYVVSRRAFDEAARGNQDLAAGIFEELSFALAHRLRVTDAELRAVEER